MAAPGRASRHRLRRSNEPVADGCGDSRRAGDHDLGAALALAFGGGVSRSDAAALRMAKRRRAAVAGEPVVARAPHPARLELVARDAAAADTRRALSESG